MGVCEQNEKKKNTLVFWDDDYNRCSEDYTCKF